jgi:hypothetical protein
MDLSQLLLSRSGIAISVIAGDNIISQWSSLSVQKKSSKTCVNTGAISNHIINGNQLDV